LARSRPFGTIRTLPSGRHQARYWHLGRQVAADVTFATKAEARAWLARMETEIGEGTYVDPALGRERFGAYAERWLTSRDLRPGTRATYASQLAHISAEFDGVELRAITPSAVRAWHGRLSQSGLHTNTVAKVYRLFRTMLDAAVDDGLIRTNPVHIKGAAVERTIERPILDWDDVQRIADAIEPRFRAMVWVAATSGLRFGELAGLMRRHVNLADRILRVDQALSFVRDQGPTVGPPKSAAAHRTVAVPASVAAMLGEHLDLYTGVAPDAFVFTSVKGSPLLNRYFWPFWKRAIDGAGMQPGGVLPRLATPGRHLGGHGWGVTAGDHGPHGPRVRRRLGYLKASERRDSEIAAAMERRMTDELNEPRT